MYAFSQIIVGLIMGQLDTGVSLIISGYISNQGNTT
jgi:hypothetical protein